MHNLTSVLENDIHKFLWNLDIQKNLDQTTRLYNNQQKKELVKLWTLLFRLTTVKLKEIEKKDKYLDLVRELKKL